jgi:hypothetical protein
MFSENGGVKRPHSKADSTRKCPNRERGRPTPRFGFAHGSTLLTVPEPSRRTALSLSKGSWRDARATAVAGRTPNFCAPRPGTNFGPRASNS